jgi:hypothetical protein
MTSCFILAKLDVAGNVAIVLYLLMHQEGLHEAHINACVDQVMLVLPEKGIRIVTFLFRKFLDTYTVLLWVGH